MGRDDHFLSRLYRLDAAQSALAVELFLHPWIVVDAVARCQLDAASERVAVALDADPLGARVISGIDGQFVTCLAPEWVNGPWPVVDRAVIEETRVAYWRALLSAALGTRHRIPDPLARHDSMQTASSVTSRESEDQGCALDERWIAVVPAIERSGYALSDSEFAALRELCEAEPAAREALLRWYLLRWKRGVSYLARRPEGYEVSPDVAMALWSTAWALVHLRAASENHERCAADVEANGASREAGRSSEVIDALDCARRAAAALRARMQQRLPHNERCSCGSGRRARRCCARRVRAVDTELLAIAS